MLKSETDMMLLSSLPHRRHRHLSPLKVILIAALGLVFYNEFLVYWMAYSNWPELHTASNSSATYRMLLVADPQLIGENDEAWFIGWLARWDADRYLRSTFALANSYVKPQATVYLGDLFDEGLKASDTQYKRYYERFKAIFKFDRMEKTFDTKQIFISGDNDIGGEYFGDRNDYLAERFEKYFGPMIDIFRLTSNIEIVKLDLDYTISFYNQVKRSYLLSLLSEYESKYKDEWNSVKYTIVLNHMSLLRNNPQELNAINEDTNAALIIKGDSHKFEIIKYSYISNRIVEHINYNKDPSNYYILDLQANKPNSHIQVVYELSIPTCSYRMGVPNMGYGMLTITRTGKAYVSILWLPSRYQCVYYYLIFLFISSAYLAFKFAFKRIFRVLARSIFK